MNMSSGLDYFDAKKDRRELKRVFAKLLPEEGLILREELDRKSDRLRRSIDRENTTRRDLDTMTKKKDECEQAFDEQDEKFAKYKRESEAQKKKDDEEKSALTQTNQAYYWSCTFVQLCEGPKTYLTSRLAAAIDPDLVASVNSSSLAALVRLWLDNPLRVDHRCFPRYVWNYLKVFSDRFQDLSEYRTSMVWYIRRKSFLVTSNIVTTRSTCCGMKFSVLICPTPKSLIHLYEL